MSEVCKSDIRTSYYHLSTDMIDAMHGTHNRWVSASELRSNELR